MVEPLWDDITRPQKLPDTARVTIGWRVPAKGRPLAEINLSVALIGQLGWIAGETRLRILASRDRTLLRLSVDGEGKLLTNHGGAGSISALLDWVKSAKRSSEPAVHRLAGSDLVIALPAWAAGGVAPGALPPEPAPVKRAEPTEPSPYTDQWTPEREALAVSLWDDPELNMTELLSRVNALPGKHIAANYLLYKHAKRLNLSNPRPYATANVRAEQPLPPLPEPEPAPAPLPPPAERPEPPVTDRGGSHRLTPSVTRAGEAISAKDQHKRIAEEVAEYLAAGMRGRAIADEMKLPLSEVLGHIAAIEAKQKAGVR